MNDRLIGKTLDGRYKILAVLGAGGMGTVYKATEIALDRVVAVKVIRPECLDEDGLARFEREAAMLASLAHANIMMFYRFGVAPDSSCYIVTEYLEGVTLRTVLCEQEVVEWRRMAAIAIQVCSALACAHQNGFVHRDLKPENIMLVNHDTVKILDFGLATIVNHDATAGVEYQKLTKTGQIIGTVNYLSPEQCAGKKSDQRSDVYSLACIIYEALLGQAPFAAENPVAVMYKHTNNSAEPFSEFAAGKNLPEEFESIVSKGLEKDPSKRYQSMSEMQEDLQALLDSDGRSLANAAKKNSNKLRTVLLVGLMFATCIAVAFMNKKSSESENDPYFAFSKLSGHAQFQAVIKEYSSSGASEKSRALIRLALGSNSLSTSERTELEFLTTTYLSMPDKIAAEVDLLRRVSGLPLRSCRAEIYSNLLHSLSGYLEKGSLYSESAPLLEAIVTDIDKHGLPEVRPGLVRRFYWSSYGLSKLALAKIKFKFGEIKEAKRLAKSVTDLDETQLPWDWLARTFIMLGEDDEARALIDKCMKPDYLCILALAFLDSHRLDDARKCTLKARKNLAAITGNKFDGDVLITELMIDLESGKFVDGKPLIEFAETVLPTLDIRKRLDVGRKIVAWLYLIGNKKEARAVLEKLDFARLKVVPINRFEYAQVVFPLLSSREADKTLQAFQIMLDAKLVPEDCVNVVVRHHFTYAHPDVINFLAANQLYLAKNEKLPNEKKISCLKFAIENVLAYHLPCQAIKACDEILNELKVTNTPELAFSKSGDKYKIWAQLTKATYLQNIGKHKESANIADEIEKESVPSAQLHGLAGLELALGRDHKLAEIVERCNSTGALCAIARINYQSRCFEESRRCLNRAARIAKSDADKIAYQAESVFMALEKGELRDAETALQCQGLRDCPSSYVLASALWRLLRDREKVLGRAIR